MFPAEKPSRDGQTDAPAPPVTTVTLAGMCAAVVNVNALKEDRWIGRHYSRRRLWDTCGNCDDRGISC